MVWVLRRRADNLIDRWDGRYYRRALALEGNAAEVRVTQAGTVETPRLQVEVEGQHVGPDTRPAVTAALEQLLGPRIDLTEFEEFAARDHRLGPLARRFLGMKPPRFPSVFECLVNAIACQQITLTLGIRILGRLTQAYGLKVGGGESPAYAFPRPEELSRCTPEELRPLGFSRQKARYLIDLSNAIVGGSLDLEALADEPDEVVLDRLLQLRGVGRWTAEYALLRGLGRVHIFPGDDVGARNNLQRWLEISDPLDYDGVKKTLRLWQAYGGLIYFHLLLDRIAESGLISEEGSDSNTRNPTS